MPSALLKQSKVRFRRRFLASAKLERIRLCSRLIENVLRFLTLRRRGRPLSEIASAAGWADACEYCSPSGLRGPQPRRAEARCRSRKLTCALRRLPPEQMHRGVIFGGSRLKPPPQPPKISFIRDRPPAAPNSYPNKYKKTARPSSGSFVLLWENITSCRIPPNPCAGACP